MDVSDSLAAAWCLFTEYKQKVTKDTNIFFISLIQYLSLTNKVGEFYIAQWQIVWHSVSKYKQRVKIYRKNYGRFAPGPFRRQVVSPKLEVISPQL